MESSPFPLTPSDAGLFSESPFCAASPNRVAVLGASGSIGTAALEVIAASGGRLKAVLLSVRRDTVRLVEAARRFCPETVIVTDPHADRAPLANLPAGTEVLFGSDALDEAPWRENIDTVLGAIVGSAGLRSALAAVQSGKTLALANKESLVMAGPILTEAARKNHARIIPVDSEHSAIYQALAAHTPGEAGACLGGAVPPCAVRRLILTASGGPFRNKTAEELEQVTVAQTLCHPTWKMGKKITVDSATMMNKAFEMIEACHLFGVPAEKIAVMIHPQSLIHSMVEFIDGAVIAQLSPPDMKLPIQLALYGGDRVAGPAARFDWTQPMAMELLPPDEERFPALALGREVAQKGGTAGTVINAANEVAVEAFLAGKIPFTKIVAACRAMLEYHPFEEHPALERLFALDARTREETLKWIS